jgi:hypothetical protein
MGTQQQRFSRRTIALFWLALAAIVIGILIYFQLISVLYVLATVSIVVLLLIVAFSDLEKVGVEGTEGFTRDLS